MEFRKDINGLRAWAVIFVILFHFKVPGFSGGGIGVDVFFVISGFLMTKIIFEGIYIDGWNGKEIIYFYFSRAKRIIPALLFLCLFLIIVGYFSLTFIEYKELSKHVISALGFFSNIQFWKESGYFDIASHKKILLHTWSLSLEWQFYIIFPVILFILRKFFLKKELGKYFLVFLFAISFVMSVVLTKFMPSASFYLLPTRAWELLAGGLVFLFLDKKVFSINLKKTFELGGIFIIIASAVFIEQKDQWPGFLALIPVTGSAMILAANGQSFLTNHSVVQWLGKTSYSLYLWHWPLAVALIHKGWHGKLIPTLGAFLATLLLGWFSWKYIENRSKDWISQLKISRGILLIGFSVFFVCSIAATISLKNGLTFRNPKAFETFNEALNKNPMQSECHAFGLNIVPECIYGEEDYGVIVIGDSHADSVIRSVEQAMQIKNKGVLDWTLADCLTINGIKRDSPIYRCSDQVSYFLEKSKFINNEIPLLIVNRLSRAIEGLSDYEIRNGDEIEKSYLNEDLKKTNEERKNGLVKGFVDTACEFAKNRKVYILKPIPEMSENVPDYMGRNLLIGSGSERVSISSEDYYKRNELALKAQSEAAQKCGATLLDPLPYLCGEGRCWGDQDGRPIYFDDDHLSLRGGDLLAPLFKKIADELS